MSEQCPTDPTALPAPARMALFTLADGAVLEVHIPNATAVECRSSTATTPGFILDAGGGS